MAKKDRPFSMAITNGYEGKVHSVGTRGYLVARVARIQSPRTDFGIHYNDEDGTLIIDADSDLVRRIKVRYAGQLNQITPARSGGVSIERKL